MGKIDKEQRRRAEKEKERKGDRVDKDLEHDSNRDSNNMQHVPHKRKSTRRSEDAAETLLQGGEGAEIFGMHPILSSCDEKNALKSESSHVHFYLVFRFELQLIYF